VNKGVGSGKGNPPVSVLGKLARYEMNQAQGEHLSLCFVRR